jgi:hypothetical protein
MGLKRIAAPRFLPIWILLLLGAAAVLYALISAGRTPTLPVPTTGNESTDRELGPPERDRISPLKDGTGA